MIFFISWPFRSCPQILESWKLRHNMLCIWQKSCSQEIGVFFSKFRWSRSPSKLKEPHEVIWEDFPFFMEQATCALIFFKSIRSSHAQLSPCLKVKKNPIQIGHHMWKILALKFGQHMELPKSLRRCERAQCGSGQVQSAPSIHPGSSNGLSEPRWHTVAGAGANLASSSLLLSICTSNLKSVARCRKSLLSWDGLQGKLQEVMNLILPRNAFWVEGRGEDSVYYKQERVYSFWG